eukprot:1639539-Pyramimonas_sp.AAC.1
MITASGDAKVSGRSSTLEKAGELKPNQKVAIKKIMKEHGAGKIGLRTAAAQLSSVLKFTVGGQETVCH